MLDQLEELTSKLLDGGLGDLETVRLNRLLCEPECRRHFVELNKLHYGLMQRSVPLTTLRTARAASAVHDSILSLAHLPGERDLSRIKRPIPAAHKRPFIARRRRVLSIVALCGSLAAVGLLAIGVFLLQPTQDRSPTRASAELQAAVEVDDPRAIRETPPPNAETFAARVVSMSDDTMWDRAAAPGDFLMRLTVGEVLRLQQGLVKLEFASAANVVLNGPADLELLGPGEVLLRHGKLTGRSEEGDFVVQTPSAYVVDVGTAFGVAVDAQAVTDIVVFDGEVHVRPSSASVDKVRLTSGMSVRADLSGLNPANRLGDVPSFNREFNGKRPSNLGTDELSLVDIICGSDPGEYRFAGSIDPEMGTWSTLPWSEAKGVRGKSGTGKVVSVDWNPWIHGIFIPKPDSRRLAVDLEGNTVEAPLLSGGAWGPVWARRRIERHLDPLASQADHDVEGFWGAGTTTALLDRSRWVRDGVVGMHANVGITLDLAAIREGYSVALKSLRGVLAHLEQSHVSQPFQPQAKSTFQVFVDGELRYERKDFCRQDGDSMFGAELRDSDRLLSIVVTDGNDGPVYDRVILLDPIFEISRN